MGDERLTIEDILKARDAMYAQPRTSIHHWTTEAEKQHLIEHNSYQRDCTTCHRIWTRAIFGS